MDVEEVRKFINAVANKHQTGNTMTPDEYNSYLPRAVDDFIRQRYGLPQDWRPGSPIPQMGWEVSQHITDDLRTLKTTPATITVDAQGQFTLPTDYWHHGALRHLYILLDACVPPVEIKRFEVPVKVVQEDKVGKHLSSTYKPPTDRYPIATYYDGLIQFYPITLATAVFSYLKYPVKPVWGSTIVADEPTYDVGTSTQIDLPDSTHIEIAHFILGYIARNLENESLMQYVESRKTRGV